MHIVSVLKVPDLENKIKHLLPQARLTVIDPSAEVPKSLHADVLLVHTRPPDNISELLRVQHGFKWVHVLGAGVDYYDRELIGDRMLTSAVGATSLAIAEFAMALLLAGAKDIPNNWVHEPPKRWYSVANEDFVQLSGSQLSLLGFGNIGSKVAKRALGFDMKVKALVRTPRQSTMEGVEFVTDLKQLLEDADHLILCVPETKLTHHIMNAESFSHCKKGIHLINVSRGGLIDESALKTALDSGQVALASLDVAEQEPVPGGHWLYSHPRVRLSPHVSWNSPHAVDHLTDRFLENLQYYAEGKALKGVVDFERGY